MKHSLYQLKWVPLLSTKQNILPSQLLDIKVVRIAPLESHLRQRMTQMTLFLTHMTLRWERDAPRPMFRTSESRCLFVHMHTNICSICITTNVSHVSTFICSLYLDVYRTCSVTVQTSNFTPHFRNHNRTEAASDEIYHMIPSLFSF